MALEMTYEIENFAGKRLGESLHFPHDLVDGRHGIFLDALLRNAPMLIRSGNHRLIRL